MPCWRIVFSTLRECMSFYTAKVKSRTHGSLTPAATLRRSPAHVLPEVCHLVRQDRDDELVIMDGEDIRVEIDLVLALVAATLGQPIRREMSARFCLPRQGQEDVGQRVAEQLGIQERERL